jgi:imidazole glycerol-phosphate synthase subunit HisH
LEQNLIAIINDKDSGNIRSVYNAVYTLGYDAEVINYNELTDHYSHVIIPGVGSFQSALKTGSLAQIKEKVNKFSETGKPVLGICLGMQLFSDWGEEGEGSDGLGLISGKVLRIPQSQELLLPHVGWNTVNLIKSHPIFEGVKSGVDFYFVHSYHFVCQNSNHVYGQTDYGKKFTSVVARDNIIGLQFHPEKSQGNGLKLIENFCDWNGLC